MEDEEQALAPVLVVRRHVGQWLGDLVDEQLVHRGEPDHDASASSRSAREVVDVLDADRRVAARSGAGGSGRRAWPVVRSSIRRRRGWWRGRMTRSAPQTLVGVVGRSVDLERDHGAETARARRWRDRPSSGSGRCGREGGHGGTRRVGERCPGPARIAAGACAARATRGTSRARRAWRRATCRCCRSRSLDRGVVRDRHAREQVGVPTDVLRGAVHDDVGAEPEWLLEDRCGERVVDGDERAGVLGGRDDRGQVGDLQERVRRRFEPDQVGVGRRVDPCRRVGDGTRVTIQPRRCSASRSHVLTPV